VKYIALNPGTSYRGFHDSLVNFGEGGPEMILCTHEEIAVAIANGYARVTGKPMATGLHNVVGLQHAAMAIFNAWCDRTPMINLDGGGPQDTNHRRSTDSVHSDLSELRSRGELPSGEPSGGVAHKLPTLSVDRNVRQKTTNHAGLQNLRLSHLRAQVRQASTNAPPRPSTIFSSPPISCCSRSFGACKLMSL
jgi:hypothetical protein